MRKIIFILCIISASVSAQNIAVQSVTKLQLNNSKGYYPELSADGSLLVFTSEDYGGLKAYDFNTKKINEITTVSGAGYRPVISTDNSTIYYIKNEFVQQRKFSSVNSFDLKTSKHTEIEPLTRTLKTPALSGDKLVYKKNNELKNKQVITPTTQQKVKTTPSNYKYVTIENQKISLYVNGKNTILNPAGVQSYIWPSLSPDGKKLLAYAIGKGAFTCNLDGSNVTFIGELQAPVWYSNEIAVGMVAEDDGHVYTKSEVFAVDIKSKQRKNIAPSVTMAMYPSASALSGKIVFNTINGDVYLVSVSTY